MAAAGYAGTVGLVGGGADFGPYEAVITSRIPWQSMELAGVGLFIAVAVPMTLCAVLAWRGSRWSGQAALAAGGSLMAWILLEIILIRTYSWMQPACLTWGVIVAAMGRHIRRSGTKDPVKPSSQRSG